MSGQTLQGLAGEARRLSTTVAAQEREAAAREGALTAAAEETASVQSALAEAQLHLQQAVADVQVRPGQTLNSVAAHYLGRVHQAEAAKAPDSMTGCRVATDCHLFRFSFVESDKHHLPEIHVHGQCAGV